MMTYVSPSPTRHGLTDDIDRDNCRQLIQRGGFSLGAANIGRELDLVQAGDLGVNVIYVTSSALAGKP